MTTGPTTTKPTPSKGSQFMAGVRDFLLVVLLVVAAAGGGYFYGSHERFAPVEYVPVATPGAVKPVVPGTPEGSSPAKETSPGAPATSN